jgi:putative acetyltransferase
VELTIRPVEPADVPAVIELVRDTLAEFGLAFGQGSPTDDQLGALPASYADHGGAFWVALTGDALAGTCGVFPVAPATLELRKMYLRPYARGLGLGAKLLATAVGWAREAGATQLVLDTTEAMTRAIEFYEAHGFVRDDAPQHAPCALPHGRRGDRRREPPRSRRSWRASRPQAVATSPNRCSIPSSRWHRCRPRRRARRSRTPRSGDTAALPELRHDAGHRR